MRLFVPVKRERERQRGGRERERERGEREREREREKDFISLLTWTSLYMPKASNSQGPVTRVVKI